MGFDALSVKGRALRYLAQREHSRAELERKLARQVTDTEVATAQQQITRALDALAAAGLLSDTRAAASVLAGQGQRSGVRRLRQILQFKGLAPDLVSDTLRRARETELQRAQDVWRRRFGVPATDPKDRARQLRFMAGRGFESDIARRVVQGSSDDDDPVADPD